MGKIELSRGENCALNYLNYVFLELVRKMNGDTHLGRIRKICAPQWARSNIQNKRFTSRAHFLGDAFSIFLNDCTDFEIVERVRYC